MVCLWRSLRHTHTEMTGKALQVFLFLPNQLCVCVSVCVYGPNCVQGLPWWFQMIQKMPACLPVVLEECGNGAERRATSPSVFIVQVCWRVSSDDVWIWRTSWMKIWHSSSWIWQHGLDTGSLPGYFGASHLIFYINTFCRNFYLNNKIAQIGCDVNVALQSF